MPRSIGDEIGKQDPFDLIEEEAFLNVWRTGAVLDHDVNALLRPHGLTKVSYNVLRILRAAGASGRTGREIGSMLVAAVPDMARLIQRLEALDFLTRTPDPDDRRVVRNVITARGRRTLKAIDPPLRELHQRQFAALSATELRTLCTLLERSRDSARGME